MRWAASTPCIATCAGPFTFPCSSPSSSARTPAAAARAEFIRVQFALRDLPADDAARPLFEERQRDLLLAHQDKWVAPLRQLGLVGSWEFRRGFVERITLTTEQALDANCPFF